MRTKAKIPKMLKEVWKMKERVYNEIKDMNCTELFSYVEDRTNKMTKIDKSTSLSSNRK